MSVVAAKNECSIIKELSHCVKENSRSGIVSCLTRIKTDEKCSQRLLENGGVSLLVELLRYRNTKVMDATLSILANACLQSHVREKVEGTKIASYVVWILKNLRSGETMHCRACRLMGNLSESNCHARALCEAGAVPALTEILRSTSNAQTLGMAVRAIRNIWIIYDGSREEILEAGTIKEITSLLIKSRKRIIERENDARWSDLAESCLKAMHVFADFTDPRLGEQMRGEKGIHGYRCIVDYCRANNKMAIKCLYKLCRYAGRRPDLGNSGAIECLLETLKSLNNSENCRRSSFSESLVSLCLFCREAVNRAKVRRGSGLETILTMLNQPHNEKYHPMLLQALAQFICDDLSIAIMVKNGLVNVLVDRLKKMSIDTKVNEKRERDCNKNGKKRSADTSPYRPASDIKFNRTSYGRFSLDYPRDDWSPGGTSTSYSSPSSTPPLLQYDANSDIDENADDNYSPICSDNEWLDNEDTNDIQNEGELSSRTRNSARDDEKEDADDFPDEGNNQYVDENYRDDNEDDLGSTSALVLLSMLSHSSDPVQRLSDSTTIQALTGYIAAAKNNRASLILTRIIRNRAYFVSLLLQGFVFEAETLYGNEHYTRELCEIAETGCAFGELASLLLRGQDSQKLIIAVSVPYVIKDREKLRILLNTHRGLDLIYQVITEPNNSLYDDAILAICKLANSLGVSSPEICRENFKDLFTEIEEEKCHESDDEPSEKCTVIFELDDGETVETKRTIICEKSEVFAAMLEGNFSESGKSRVRLKNASKDGLSTLLAAMNGKYSLRNYKIEAILDAVILADKYLMSDVSERLTEISIARLNHENLCSAWTWSKNNSCDELRNCCVKIFLTSNMTRKHRLRAFNTFSESSSFSEFVKDTRDLIAHSLALSTIF